MAPENEIRSTPGEDWARLSALLDDAPEVAAVVTFALTDPEAYFLRYQDDLLERGIEEPEDVDPWIGLLDALDQEGALAYLDWKDSGVELVDAMSAVPRVVASGVDIDPAADVDGSLETAIAHLDGLLAGHDLRVLLLDEDSDAYPLVVVPAGNVEEIVVLAGRVGHEVRRFS